MFHPEVVFGMCTEVMMEQVLTWLQELAETSYSSVHCSGSFDASEAALL